MRSSLLFSLLLKCNVGMRNSLPPLHSLTATGHSETATDTIENQLTTSAPGLVTGEIPDALVDSAAIIGDDAFAAMIIHAAGDRGDGVVALGGANVELHRPYKVSSGGRPIELRGPGRITGFGHSVLQTGGSRQRLTIRGVDLRHLAVPESGVGGERDGTVGGAIFALGKSRVELTDCSVTSHHGYGVWAVQGARVALRDCDVRHCGRSAVALFGSATLTVRGGRLRDCGQHGVCARGQARVDVEGAALSGNAHRGVYGYHNATVRLARTAVSPPAPRRSPPPTDAVVAAGGTATGGDGWVAAVHVEALRDCDRARLTLSGCTLDGGDGAGVAMLVKGNVEVTVDGVPWPA